jgi:ribosomal protein S18 acetylase RimI-like enzyme
MTKREESSFDLSRATTEDLYAIANVEYLSFPPFIRKTFMGCSSEGDLPRLVKYYQDGLRNDPHTIWIIVTDRRSKEVIAASQWKVYPNYAPADSADDRPADWLEGEVLQKTKEMMSSMNEKRRIANPGGYVHLHIAFTHPDFRRRGAGNMVRISGEETAKPGRLILCQQMMRWGCDVADALGVPGWIEASVSRTVQVDLR